jgi:hypothetical protein
VIPSPLQETRKIWVTKLMPFFWHRDGTLDRLFQYWMRGEHPDGRPAELSLWEDFVGEEGIEESG